MKKINLIFTILILLFAISFVVAQDRPPPNDFDNQDVENDRPPDRGDILAKELGLTKEQQLQIRNINKERRPMLQQAQRRFNQAKTELDDLIYSDTLDETSLKNKIREVSEAQGEIAKIRAMSEVAVRNVLTPDQLVKFRDIRTKFKEQQQQRQINRRQQENRRQMNRNNQNNRQRPLPNRNRPQ